LVLTWLVSGNLSTIDPVEVARFEPLGPDRWVEPA
jgi:hypothetical protein